MFETSTELELDPVIEAYKKDIDRTLLRENLRLTVEQRLENLMRLQGVRGGTSEALAQKRWQQTSLS